MVGASEARIFDVNGVEEIRGPRRRFEGFEKDAVTLTTDRDALRVKTEVVWKPHCLTVTRLNYLGVFMSTF